MFDINTLFFNGDAQMIASHKLCIVLGLSLAATMTTAIQAQEITQEHLLNPDIANPSVSFGEDIALDGHYVVVSAADDEEMGPNFGAVYLYEQSSGELIVKLFSDHAEIGGRFGTSIAIDDGLITVSAPSAQYFMDGQWTAGGVVFLFDASTGEQIVRLTGNDTEINDHFGSEVALSNGVLAVGASGDGSLGPSTGAVYLFNTHTHEQIAKIKASDAHSFHQFGRQIAMDDGLLAVAAIEELPDILGGSGSVYIYDISTQDELGKLMSDDHAWHGRAGSDQFGESLDIDDGIVVVGASSMTNLTKQSDETQQGAAYIFDAFTGQQLRKLVATDQGSDREYGAAVGIENGLIAIGSPGNQTMYFYDAATGEEQDRFSPAVPMEGSTFGAAIAMHNRNLAVGNNTFSTHFQDFYPSYLLHIDCKADLNSDDLLDFFDVSEFLEAFVSSDPVADFTDDGLFDFFDVSDFLEEFSGNCL